MKAKYMIDTLSKGQQLVVDGDDGDNKLAHVGHICFLVQFLEFSGQFGYIEYEMTKISCLILLLVIVIFLNIFYLKKY
jgi:predicted regulator of Ras-like GTPase activity (Roadblock/LC7/MglB family)